MVEPHKRTFTDLIGRNPFSVPLLCECVSPNHVCCGDNHSHSNIQTYTERINAQKKGAMAQRGTSKGEKVVLHKGEFGCARSIMHSPHDTFIALPSSAHFWSDPVGARQLRANVLCRHAPPRACSDFCRLSIHVCARKLAGITCKHTYIYMFAYMYIV